jgi:hypothetical protein
MTSQTCKVGRVVQEQTNDKYSVLKISRRSTNKQTSSKPVKDKLINVGSNDAGFVGWVR